jgi:hypothetical protein
MTKQCARVQGISVTERERQHERSSGDDFQLFGRFDAKKTNY